jgi:hypothetical protein
MYLGHISGFVFFPVAVITLLNALGITNFDSIFGFQLIFLAAIGVIVVEACDIIDSHISGESVILTWLAAGLLAVPGIIFFLSRVIAMPENITTPLPIILGSFLFVEGVMSFFIGD